MFIFVSRHEALLKEHAERVLDFLVPDLLDILVILKSAKHLDQESGEVLYNQASDNIAVLDWLQLPTDGWKERFKVIDTFHSLIS